MIVTDSGRDAALSKIDLIMLETLAQNLATVLENARLYEGLKREERLREHVIRSMSNGLVTVDLEGRVRLFNQAAERLSGYAAADVRSRACGELFYEGKPATADITSPTGEKTNSAGDSRDGGSYEERFSKVAVWNNLMDEAEFLFAKWNEFNAA